MNDLVSIIVPTYGEPKYLNKALMSVLSQTYQFIELIVIDDNDPSTAARKETETVIENIKSEGFKLKYVQHEQNKNGAAARNTGICHAKGTYIGFLDSDDEYLPCRIERLIDALKKSDRSAAGAYTGCEFKKNGKVYSTYTDVKTGQFPVETLACTFMFCTGSNIFVSSQVIRKLGGFDEKFIRHQDYEFLVRLFQKYELIGIQEVLVVKNNDNFNLPNVEKMIKVKEMYLEKFSQYISSLSDSSQRFILRKNYIAILEQALMSKRKDIAICYFKKAKLYGGLSIKEYFRCLYFSIRSLVRK